MKLNIGCGDNKIAGFVNIDAEESNHPDLVLEVGNKLLPFDDGTVKEVVMFHTLEHISKSKWVPIFMDINRVLQKDGKLVLSYPEFRICYRYWEENHRGMKEFWEACIFGRQSHPHDFHVSICHSPAIAKLLHKLNFLSIDYFPEPDQPQYTILSAKKAGNVRNKEDVIKGECF